MRLLIAIPLYNERRYVGEVLQKVMNIHSDVLVVDDGSTDGSADLAAAIAGVQLVRHSKNLGYGQSLIDAFAHATKQGYDWVITMDCDQQHEPEQIPEFIREIETDRWDLISGSRYLVPRADDQPAPDDRKRINASLTEILNDEFKLKLTDAFCGFKAHRVSAMARLKLTVAGYAFPMQLWPQAVKAGLRITEIPVRLIYNDPNRHFGGLLDDAAVRYAHYLYVLGDEGMK